MQSNTTQHEQISTSSAPRSTSPSGGGSGTNNKPPPRMQDLPAHPPQQRFTLTPQSVGMDMRLTQPRQQQEQSLQSRPDSTTMQHTVVSNQPYINEQQEQRQSPYHNVPSSSKTVMKESVTELKSFTTVVAATAASMYKPVCSERRPSSPLSPTSTFPHGDTTLTHSLSSTTTQTPCRPSNHPGIEMLSSPSTPTNERQCYHPAHDSMQAQSALLQEIPTGHFEQQLQKLRSGSNFFTGGAAEINAQLNEIFVNRLNDIDANGQGDSNLKLVTYQEWVEMLLKINESILINVEELETEVAKRLEYVQQRVNLNCRHSQGNELMKCRKDIETLVKLIQNAYHYNSWDFHGVTLETITPAQVLGLADGTFELRNTDAAGGSEVRNSSDAECIQRNKLLANMKALALEVAEKHDEVRDLKRQVVCMEDEIQKAQKKIQFKDDVIKELRNDLKRNAKLASPLSVDGCLVMPPINLESETPRSNTSTLVSDGNPQMFPDECVSRLESLSENERLEQDKIKLLEHELNDLLEISRHNKDMADKQRERLRLIFQQSESGKVAAYRKLDFLRRQLVDLENSAVASVSVEGATNDCDSGFSSRNENDQDTKILDAVRKLFRNLKQTTCQLSSRVEKLERDNNELSASLKSSKILSQRNDETLKDVAELLCNVTGNQFSYTDIYKNSSQCQMNPFCEAIMDMKRIYQQREAQLLQAMSQKNQKIEELMQTLINKEKIFSEHQRLRVNLSEGEDIDNITPPSSLSLQPQQSTFLHEPLQTSLLKRHEEDSLTVEERRRKQL